MKKIFGMTFFLLGFLISVASFASDREPLDLKKFGTLSIMHEGRTKPMDSFARSLLKTYSGSDDGALMWLIETLFNPAHAENIQVIKIINPDVLNLLEMDIRQNHLYSYNEISKALAKNGHVLMSIIKAPEEDWTPAQRDFVSLQKKIVSLGDLLSSMTLYLPLSVQLPEDGSPKSLRPYVGQSLTYLDTLKFQETLQKEMKSIIKRQGENIESYSNAEKQITILSFTSSNLRLAGQRSQSLQVIPLQNGTQWASPWQTILGQGSPETKGLFDAWANLAMAYHNNDNVVWNEQIDAVRHLTFDLGKSTLRPTALEIEYAYNQLSPLSISAWLYALSLILCGVQFVRKTESVAIPLITFSLATFIHVVGITLRILILERPPVSTLYESIIFVGAIVAIYGLILFWHNRNNFWVFIGAGGGLLLILLSYTHNQNGDNLMMLSAVLNTNFWLATHVICIALGYAFCLITSMLAHVALFKPEQKLLEHVKVVALISLLLTALGTVLGGIWADQSWGRFWGWDPKENGALLIVLWLIWILHGRISGHMNALFVNIGLAYLSVIVALSWFGVNLLNVGLHAYGFTDSAALGLVLFIILETALISGIVLYKRRQLHAL